MKVEQKMLRVEVVPAHEDLRSIQGVDVVNRELDVENCMRFVDARPPEPTNTVPLRGYEDEFAAACMARSDQTGIGWAEPTEAGAGVR